MSGLQCFPINHNNSSPVSSQSVVLLFYFVGFYLLCIFVHLVHAPFIPIICPILLNSSLLENCFCWKIFRLKIQNLGLKIPRFWIFGDKVEILNTHNILCRKFSAACRSYLFAEESRLYLACIFRVWCLLFDFSSAWSGGPYQMY